jgi:hypothetical protein
VEGNVALFAKTQFHSRKIYFTPLIAQYSRHIRSRLLNNIPMAMKFQGSSEGRKYDEERKSVAAI